MPAIRHTRVSATVARRASQTGSRRSPQTCATHAPRPLGHTPAAGVRGQRGHGGQTPAGLTHGYGISTGIGIAMPDANQSGG